MKSKQVSWTKEMEQVILDNHSNSSNKEMADMLGLRVAQVAARIQYLRKKGYNLEYKLKPVVPFSEEEEQYLLDNIEKTNKELAKDLNRSVGFITRKVREIMDARNTTTARGVITEQDRREQKIYDKLINKKVDKGIKLDKLKVSTGKTYKVKQGVGYKHSPEKFIGKVIQQTENHITLKSDKRTETFLKVDFLIGEAKIKEVNDE